MDSQPVIGSLTQHQDQAVDELVELLRMPSVSADPAFHDDCLRTAQFVHQQLESCGFQTETVPTEGLPIVYAEWTQAPNAPTALVYGHYDVQPPDPLDEWKTPPFEPTVRDGRLYARGATDDKGQFFTHIKSVQAWLDTQGSLPVNVKFVIEGEEEVGSDNLEHFLQDRREQLSCDVCVISDTAQYGDGIPAITYGLRGIMVCEVTLHGPHQDLHSGVFGGAVCNPVNALATMIGRLKDDEGRIQIPGFYDDVVLLTDEERESFAKLPFDESAFCDSLGIPATFGEAGFSTLEQRWARPTCDVNGLFGGYMGEGPKTIIPAKATAKISCRLVPNQDPHRLLESLEDFLKSQRPPSVRMDFKVYHGCPAMVCDTDSPYMSAAKAAIKSGFGSTPVLMREGGSIPVRQLGSNRFSGSIRCCSDGAETRTTCMAPTSICISPISIMECLPVPTSGRSWPNCSHVQRHHSQHDEIRLTILTALRNIRSARAARHHAERDSDKRHMIDLDHNATTRPLPEVVATVCEVMRNAYANPGSRHAAGRRARQVLEDARETVAEALSVQPQEVVFTSGGTESTHLALMGFAQGRTGTLIALPGEHPATEGTLQFLEHSGWSRHTLPIAGDGRLKADVLTGWPTDGPAIATMLLAHNETGVIQDVQPIAMACREAGIPLHLDAVQAVGKIDINFHDFGGTTMSVGAHKFHGPRGIGALIVKDGVTLPRVSFGGHQERSRRAGTECVALAAGMACALRLWHDEREQRSSTMRQLRDRLQERLTAECSPVVINGSTEYRLPNTLNIAFPGCDGEALLVALDLAGIAASLGSACASGSSEPAAILVAMGCSDDVLQSSLRLAVGIDNTLEEIDQAAKRIREIVHRLRRS